MHDATYRIDDLPEQLASLILPDFLTGCWLWAGRTHANGYGRLYWNGRSRVIHRVIWTLLVGPIPDGLVLDHVHTRGCCYRRCCWPGHLEPVTVGENNRRWQVLVR